MRMRKLARDGMADYNQKRGFATIAYLLDVTDEVASDEEDILIEAVRIQNEDEEEFEVEVEMLNDRL
jgi:hypothetical protein